MNLTELKKNTFSSRKKFLLFRWKSVLITLFAFLSLFANMNKSTVWLWWPHKLFLPISWSLIGLMNGWIPIKCAEYANPHGMNPNGLGTIWNCLWTVIMIKEIISFTISQSLGKYTLWIWYLQNIPKTTVLDLFFEQHSVRVWELRKLIAEALMKFLLDLAM